ncbi:glycoside hydrolase family 79 protein [Aaosphaeria arxii CBS 175.79]|uniref:Glycoside hydrolase family 79 protein n=1 Tax=Aaosphaeria arxii CBS 175.79 TaxID=1450172 RepID=A0A6A5XAN7_9PLEO|nr:glycoside hydrolase family 79 protein [Aaosphaeria arxii CBS 175.79]KAF2010022.1 glycoside hydrolase family 79 protein [Aaosphaeria arxii CBS 175.79]
MLRSLCPSGLLLSFATQSLAQSISLSIAPKATDTSVSDALDPSFAGFGIEPSNLFTFTGDETPNNFSIQLMQNLADYSGKPPHIRLGGNAQDYLIYDETYKKVAWKPNAASSAQGTYAADSIIVGPGYFEAVERFPKDTPVTVGLNMAYSGADYLERISTMAQAAVDNLNNVKLYSFEIGNEPDLWLKNLFRTAPWDGKVYTQEFLARADAIYQRVLKPAGLPANFFEAQATASTIGTTFEINMLIDDGMLDEVNGNKYVSAWNQHDYFYFFEVTPKPITLDDLMDLDQTNTQFLYWEKQTAIGLKTGLPFVLREMCSIGPIGYHGISDTHGASLWTLNFFLYAASLGISSVQMHMTVDSNASAWQPQVWYGNPQHVRPQYYAHAAIAQIIGNGNGTTQIASVKASGSGDYKGRIRAYASYAQGVLRSLVLINSKMANSSESKGSFTFNLDLGSDYQDRDVFISYLTADGAESLDTTTFNAMKYSDTDGLASRANEDPAPIRTSSTGAISIPVRDSEAVVANIEWLLGSTEVINGDGSKFKGNKASAAIRISTGASTIVWTTATLTIVAGFFLTA